MKRCGRSSTQTNVAHGYLLIKRLSIRLRASPSRNLRISSKRSRTPASSTLRSLQFATQSSEEKRITRTPARGDPRASPGRPEAHGSAAQGRGSSERKEGIGDDPQACRRCPVLPAYPSFCRQANRRSDLQACTSRELWQGLPKHHRSPLGSALANRRSRHQNRGA